MTYIAKSGIIKMHQAIRLESRGSQLTEVDKMKDARNIKVIVLKDGEARELRNLPEETLLKLEEAYEKAPIRGLSHKTYMALADFFENRLAEYEAELNNADDDDMFSRTIAFAKAFDISYNESPALFDMMLMIERNVREHQNFDSREICIKNLKSMIGMDWRDANHDFRMWARKLFEDTGLKIGVIRMTKFFYGVITAIA